MKKTIATIVGARPQFIKAAVVTAALRRFPELDEYIIHTGQHYDTNMSDVFFSELSLPKPKYELKVGSGPHGDQTGRMLGTIEATLVKDRPSAVIVYGDTNSTLAGALAAVKLGLPVIHIEAGVRSFDRRMPEEINRVVTDHLSSLLLVPLEDALENLRNEGISGPQVQFTGDIMFDMAVQHSAQARQSSSVLRDLKLTPGKFALVTIHRPENTDQEERLRNLLRGCGKFAQTMPVLWPVHPRTSTSLRRLSSEVPQSAAIQFIEPLGYRDMLAVESTAAVIGTDSGGVQREAFFHKVPSVVFRDNTEWVPLLTSGWSRLVPPTSPESVFEGLKLATASKGTPLDCFGKGDASVRCAEAISRFLSTDHE